MNIPEKEKLDLIAKKLAEILRIQDWDITIKLISAYDMGNKYNDYTDEGVSDRDIRLNTAEIYLNRDNCSDWYEVLVHELLHIQSTELIKCAEAYFQGRHTYFSDIYESLTEKQAQIFCKLYPLSNFDNLME